MVVWHLIKPSEGHLTVMEWNFVGLYYFAVDLALMLKANLENWLGGLIFKIFDTEANNTKGWNIIALPW